MASDSPMDSRSLDAFRARANRVRQDHPEAWQASSRLIGQARLADTLARLAAAIEASGEPTSLREVLLAALHQGRAGRVQELPAELLKQITGLPASKALRALCVLFGLAGDTGESVASATALAPEAVAAFLADHPNPYDLLLAADRPSLLDLGAGDLSFLWEVAEHYLPLLRRQGKRLLLHGLDRIQPGSRLGGLLQPEAQRVAALRRLPDLDFQHWSGQDLFDLDRIRAIRPRYTLVTCHAPPTPTVAYEPSRLASAVIAAHLRETKGSFRKVRVEGEEALEVLHQGRALLFPPWKFDVKGPLALLTLIARKGGLGVLGAVDNEVFWEILAQLLAGERFRPRDRIFTPSALPEVFGEVHSQLAALPAGGSLALEAVAPLRQDLPFRFRHVEVRRGATFEGQPAGRTARLFKDMTDEVPPWMLILVPDQEENEAS